MKFFPWEYLAVPEGTEEKKEIRFPRVSARVKLERFVGRTFLFLKRAARAVRFLPVFLREAAGYQGETCRSCGRAYHMAWSVPDEMWIAVYGSENGCLCPSCFVRKANEKGITVSREQIEIIIVNEEIKKR